MDQQANTGVEPIQNPPAPATTPYAPSRNTILIIGGIFLLTLVSVVAYYFLFLANKKPQQSNSVAESQLTPSLSQGKSKTLISNFCGIAITLPSSWDGKLTEQNGCLFTSEGPLEDSTKLERYFEVKSVDSKAWNTSLSIQKSFGSPKTITINGVAASEFQHNPDTTVNGIQDQETRTVYVNKGNLHLIVWFSGDLTNPDTKKMYDQLINSITFTMEPEHYNTITIDSNANSKLTNDTIRGSDINALLNAIHQFKSDHNVFPAEITSQAKDISSEGSNLCTQLVPSFLASLPVDPKFGEDVTIGNCKGNYNTYYKVVLNSDGTITVFAPNAELEKAMSVTR